MNGPVKKTIPKGKPMTEIELRNPAKVDVTVYLEGEKYVLEERTTHHIEI